MPAVTSTADTASSTPTNSDQPMPQNESGQKQMNGDSSALRTEPRKIPDGALLEDPSQALIAVRQLFKIYRVGDERVHALDGVSFEVKKGEFCTIVGTSGSGKSTLLNMLAGLEPPSRGSIKIAGTQLVGLKESELVTFRREKVGFIFQSFNLIPSLSAIENVALPLTFRGEQKATRTKKAIILLHTLGLGKHLYHKPTEMSGGQQQRVGIARALVVNPEIIFADEPTGNLDSHTSGEIMALIQSIVKKHHQTFIMVTHDDKLAEWGDRVFRISDGRLISVQPGTHRYEQRVLQQEKTSTETSTDKSPESKG